MNQLPWWPPVILLLLGLVILAKAKYDSVKFDKKYGKDGIGEE